MFTYPPFSLTKPMYDMDTYGGRTRHHFSAINPLLCFETERSLLRHRLLLSRVADGEHVQATAAQLWRARTAVESCVHPTTGDVIAAPFRMCAFLPVNMILMPVMMARSTLLSVPRTVFVQWLNQSYNCAVNYANRSSDRQPPSALLRAYAAAVLVSVGGALAATALLRRAGRGTARATIIRATVPFLAVSAAAIANLALMRRSEWAPPAARTIRAGETETETIKIKSESESESEKDKEDEERGGVAVADEDGAVRGRSRVAGADSLRQCAATRVLWNVPVLVLPTALAAPLAARFECARARPVLLETALQSVGLAVGVPSALGVFRTTAQIDAGRLEAPFRDMRRKDGTPVKTFSYYKGL